MAFLFSVSHDEVQFIEIEHRKRIVHDEQNGLRRVAEP